MAFSRMLQATYVKWLITWFLSFENLFIKGDLNMTTENTHLNDLIQIYDLTAHIKELTCYQSQNSNCIDHF